MIFKANYQTSPFVFTGNPVILESEGYNADKIKGARFIVYLDGRQIYEGRFFPPLDIDISEIAGAASEYFAEPSLNGRVWELIEEIDPLSDDCTRRLKVFVDYNGEDDETFEMIALPGGISRQQFKFYAAAGKDVFDARLYGQACNLFFTTRTQGWRIEMKETELYPLYFLAPRKTRLKIRDAVTDYEIFHDLSAGVCTLDPDALRREMLSETGTLSSVFNIYLDFGGGTEFGCQLVITRVQPATERYRLKFRNSFGVFEIMEISGKLEEKTEFSEIEEKEYRHLDPVTRHFSNLRSRLEATKSFTVTTPLAGISKEFLTDLLASEEVYLLDAYKTPARVIVSAEDFSRRYRSETPESITLGMELSDPDLYFGDEITTLDDSRKPRVHNDKFTKEFN